MDSRMKNIVEFSDEEAEGLIEEAVKAFRRTLQHHIEVVSRMDGLCAALFAIDSAAAACAADVEEIIPAARRADDALADAMAADATGGGALALPPPDGADGGADDEGALRARIRQSDALRDALQKQQRARAARSIRNLTLVGCPGMTDESCSTLGQIRSLRVLSINVSNGGAVTLTGLTSLLRGGDSSLQALRIQGVQTPMGGVAAMSTLGELLVRATSLRVLELASFDGSASLFLVRHHDGAPLTPSASAAEFDAAWGDACIRELEG